MLINVKAITGARKNQVKSDSDGFKVYVTAPAVDNKANRAIIQLLAEYFKTRKSAVNITRGEKSNRKTIEIPSLSFPPRVSFPRRRESRFSRGKLQRESRTP